MELQGTDGGKCLSNMTPLLSRGGNLILDEISVTPGPWRLSMVLTNGCWNSKKTPNEPCKERFLARLEACMSVNRAS